MNTQPAGSHRLLARLFSAGLRLYPASWRESYEEEAMAVFQLNVQHAARRGKTELLAAALRELRDLPAAAAAAHIGLPGGVMTHYFPDTSDQPSWGAALFSLLPLLIAGPGRIIVFYTSGFSDRADATIYIPYLALCILAALVALGIGAAQGFPRWAYPYPLALAFALTDLYNTATYYYGWPTIGQRSLFYFLALILLVLSLPRLRAFYDNIRQDWTLLSYAMFGFALYLLAQLDRDEYPVLALGVLLPSLIALLAALAHLRIRQAPVRVLALLVGTFIGLFFWLIGIFTGMISIFIGIAIGLFMLAGFGLALAALILSPLLVILLRQALPGKNKL